MFSLIISIISIALVAALAAATVYFGGAAFNKGSAGADASTFINAGQQVAGAFTLAAADGYTVATVEDLNAGDAVKTKGEIYLAQIPSYKGTPFTVSTEVGETSYSTIVLDSDDVCKEINKRANGSSTGNVVAAVTDVEGLYGCVTADKKAFYKVK